MRITGNESQTDIQDRPMDQLPFPWDKRFTFGLGPLAMSNTPRMPDGPPSTPWADQWSLFDNGDDRERITDRHA